MSLMGKATFSKHDQMRYRFMMQLFGLRLDKRQFKKDFGVSVERGLPVEMAFMKASGAFDRDNADELTLTPKGRYLMVVMMRQFFIGVNTCAIRRAPPWWVRNASLSSATANNRLSASARTPKRLRICRGRFSCVPSRVRQRVPARLRARVSDRFT